MKNKGKLDVLNLIFFSVISSFFGSNSDRLILWFRILFDQFWMGKSIFIHINTWSKAKIKDSGFLNWNFLKLKLFRPSKCSRASLPFLFSLRTKEARWHDHAAIVQEEPYILELEATTTRQQTIGLTRFKIHFLFFYFRFPPSGFFLIFRSQIEQAQRFSLHSAIEKSKSTFQSRRFGFLSPKDSTLNQEERTIFTRFITRNPIEKLFIKFNKIQLFCRLFGKKR